MAYITIALTSEAFIIDTVVVRPSTDSTELPQQKLRGDVNVYAVRLKLHIVIYS